LARGAEPLTYQWYKDENAIVSATNSDLLFPAVALEDSGAYRVRVNGPNGTVFSLSVMLNVLPLIDTNAGGLLLDPITYERVYKSDGITPVGKEFVAQICVGPDATRLRPIGSPFGFGANESIGRPGGPREVLVATLSTNVNAVAQLRAWEKSFGASYEHARAAGGEFGHTPVVQVQQYIWGRVFNICNFPSFNLHAGLPEFTTGSFGMPETQLDGSLIWTFQGNAASRYLIEVSSSQFSWEPFQILSSDSGNFTFTSRPQEQQTQFFRARILD
jgi:hypothetical protein